jgi:hypothetical protein
MKRENTVGRYYKSADELFEIYGYFLDRLLRDSKVGAKMATAGVVIKFVYTDPDCEITIDLKNPPAKPGYYGTFYLGPCDVKEDAWSEQSADHSHRFWHGYDNPVASVAKGKVKQGGDVMAMLRLLPVVKPAFKMFPMILEEMGRTDLIIRDKNG